jgi:outer membrane protein TolC
MEDMAVKVKTGRAPESELLKIQKTLNDLEQQQDELATKRIDTLKELRSLTGTDLTEPVPMALVQEPSGDTFLAVTAAQYASRGGSKRV